ncbi:aspartate-semialdehyde dehydrogenase (plasmid) [Deinococcus aetherius]|uniref:Aspartate-semialdehyde dehydrogenase n=1 Tax=Deinococcus aetherius TaxID=200252 RepID=A0ABN6RMH3_9DEIO|nr:aspartate-semialdehyde dehydrogenase [Deinococcus aetherius]BDP44500.1 aspartate-semialdehyde dehydrogenase [Deinococcus aetherius]
MPQKLRAGILAATGTIGQRFVELLADHPHFEITALAASSNSAGKTYREACAWQLSSDPPASVAGMVVRECTPDLECDVVFSALPTDQARDLEPQFAAAGYKVFTNASAYRMQGDVPLLIPEVNPDHLQLVKQQKVFSSGGFIAANPNCSAAVVVPALAPLHRTFGVRAVIVNTMQALSGAGYPGVPSLDALDNVIPYIPTEEEKMAAEAKKMLGDLLDGHHHDAAFKFSAHCNRVPTRDGHIETVSVALERPASLEDIARVWREWTPEPQQLGLPTAPYPVISLRTEPNRPQTRLDRDAGRGMTVTVGRLRACEVLDFKFVALAHNAVRGAAGGSVLNAELALARGYLG